MGYGSFKTSDWESYKTTRHVDTARTVDDIMSTGASSVKNEWLPKGITRESCDSDEHPNSTPIVFGLDATGSMDDIIKTAAQGVGKTMTEIINRDCVPDPQILFSVIDDYITSAERCVQVTQFESDIKIAEQMYDLSFIGRGGGNNWESYATLWYFVVNHTKCDAIKKGRKGVIITVGDDGIQPTISASEIKTVFGDRIEESCINTKELYSQLSRDWEIFHISCIRGYHERSALESWDKLIGKHHIRLDDVDKLCEVMVSLVQTVKGDSVADIVKSWDHSTGLVVANALNGLVVNGNKSSDVVVF